MRTPTHSSNPTPAAPDRSGNPGSTDGLSRLEIRYSRENGDYEILDTADNYRWLGAARSYSEADDVLRLLAPSYPPVCNLNIEAGCEVCQQAVATWRVHTKDYIAFACDTCYTKHWANNEHNVNPWEADPTVA